MNFEQGKCRELDPKEAEKIFFIEPGGTADAARAVCNQCVILEDCRDWAVENWDDFGIVAGLSVRELRQERIKRCATK
jgi:hypothetical protein